MCIASVSTAQDLMSDEMRRRRIAPSSQSLITLDSEEDILESPDDEAGRGECLPPRPEASRETKDLSDGCVLALEPSSELDRNVPDSVLAPSNSGGDASSRGASFAMVATWPSEITTVDATDSTQARRRACARCPPQTRLPRGLRLLRVPRSSRQPTH
eukprot:m.189054 g.189054  ORF g.189054 m.189054 type:complete len:158 (-) comp15096_c0_seq3:425-898(-)